MTLRVCAIIAAVACAVAAPGATQQRSGRGTTPAKPAAPPSVVRAAGCASPLGDGVKMKRPYCDVIIAALGADSVSMDIPAHTGPATLFFDLHPRFEVSQPDGNPGTVFQRHTAVVAIVGPTGDVIDRAVAAGEFRSTNDLFDRLPGQGPGGFKVVGPGTPLTIKVAIPPNISSVGIVGLRVEIMNRFTRSTYPEPGRPVAIVSNWRVEYTAK